MSASAFWASLDLRIHLGAVDVLKDSGCFLSPERFPLFSFTAKDLLGAVAALEPPCVKPFLERFA